MFSKKMCVIFTTLAIFSMPIITHASVPDLQISNHTQSYSSVSTTSTAKPRCSGTIGTDGYTEPGQDLSVKNFEVNSLCNGSKDKICEADILIMATSAEALSCTGNSVRKIAHAKLNMSTDVVTEVSNVIPGYTIDGVPSSHIIITQN
jgi:hypothetical protein